MSDTDSEDSVVISKANLQTAISIRSVQYHLHYCDASDGSIIRIRQFEADSDKAAIAYSEEVRSLSRMELWQADRRVKQWDSFPPSVVDE